MKLDDLLAGAGSGDIQAAADLGEAYYLGKNGAEKNWFEAVKWLTYAADNKNPQAQYGLGLCYVRGEGTAKNVDKGAELLKAASRQGHILAKFSLGVYYNQKCNYSEAFSLFKPAAEKGYAEAQAMLGLYIHEGLGSKKDLKEAFRWFTASAEQEHPLGLYNLGVCYLNGEGTNKNPNLAYKYLKMSAEKGCDEAEYALAHCLYTGELGGEKPDEYIEWYKKAASHCHKVALYHLGFFYLSGKGVEEDHKEAVRCLNDSAEQDYAEAQYLLGLCFKEGCGVEKDEKEALSHFKQAAQNGNTEAQKYIDDMLESGIKYEQKCKELKEENNELKQTCRELREYIARQEKVTMQGMDKILGAVNNIGSQMKSVAEDVKDTNEKVTDMNEKVTRIDENLIELIELMKMIPSKIDELREALKKRPDFEDVFVEEACKTINNSLGGKAVEKTRRYLKQRFGNAWEKLHRDTQKSLISSWAMWEEFRTNMDFDFSGVVICATGALENELKRKLYYKFKDFAEKLSKEEKLLSPLTKKPFTLGRLPFLFGKYDPDIRFNEDEQQAFNDLREKFLRSVMIGGALEQYGVDKHSDCFTKEIFPRDSESEPIPTNDDSFEDNSLIVIINHITNKFRNPSAHTGNISQAQAQKCCDLIFSPDAKEKMDEINSVLIKFHMLLKDNYNQHSFSKNRNNKNKPRKT